MRHAFGYRFMTYLLRKPEIPAYMRAQIDEAVAAGRVTKIPAGVSAESYVVWCDRRRALVDPDAKTAVQLNREARARAARAGTLSCKPPQPEKPTLRQTLRANAEARRESVRRLYVDGWSYRQISEELDVTVSRVKKDIYDLLKADPKLKRRKDNGTVDVSRDCSCGTV